MASDPKKCDFLAEHLLYQLLMLRHTHEQIVKPQGQLTWNAMYESFAVHARNLFVFLKNSDNNKNMRASDYISDFKVNVPPAINSVRLSLDPHVLHLGKIRKESDRKPHVEKLNKLYVWLGENLARFGAELPDKFRKHWQPEKAHPTPDYIETHSSSGTVQTIWGRKLD